jgi:hypothetical protein
MVERCCLRVAQRVPPDRPAVSQRGRERGGPEVLPLTSSLPSPTEHRLPATSTNSISTMLGWGSKPTRSCGGFLITIRF